MPVIVTCPWTREPAAVQVRGVPGRWRVTAAGDVSGIPCVEVLAPVASLLMAGDDRQVRARLSAIERRRGWRLQCLCPGRRVLAPPVRVVVRATLANRATRVRRLVPAQVALARLACELMGDRRVGVCWSDGGSRLLLISRRGIPEPGDRSARRWLCCGPGARRFLQSWWGETNLPDLVSAEELVPGASPGELLALGGALARRSRASLPEPERRLVRAIPWLFTAVLALAAVASGSRWWVHRRHRDDLRQQAAAARATLEELWQQRPGSPPDRATAVGAERVR